MKRPQFSFNRWVIEQTHDLVCAYKPNLAFYEARGAAGWEELKLTLEYLKKNYPELVTIADAKRADIGNTNLGYAVSLFDELGFDGMTVHPYLGKEALEPFLERQDKGIFVLCRTSNPGAGELQDLTVEDREFGRLPLYELVARRVAKDWNGQGNCGLVVGATYPRELRQVREIAGEMPLLVPGVGAQGGDVEQTIRAGINRSGMGIIINSARGIIFAADPGLEALKLKEEINRYRKGK